MVEDDAIIAAAEAETLRSHGFNVVLSRSGEDALAVSLSDADISLILMDIDLGEGMDGAESARAILAKRGLPIVFLSRHSEREVVERVKHISGYGYVLKSSGEFVLVETIYMALRLFETQTRLEQENIEHLRTAEKLRERNAFIETVLDNLPIGLSVNYIDDGTATYMNKRFEAVYGWPREILTDVSRFFECVFPEPVYRNELQAKILADMASGDPTRMVWDDIVATTQNGEKRIVLGQNIPIPEQNLMISTVQDLTEKSQAQEALRSSEEKYRLLVNSLNEGVIQIDSDGSIVFINARMAEMLGYTIAEMLGCHLLEFMDERGKEITREAMQRRRRGVQEQMEAEFICRDGKRLHVLVDTGPIIDQEGEYQGAIAGIMDITARKEAQHLLEKQSHEKSLLLRETHHRIKNNIASIASLLSMQAEETSIPEARAALNEATSRVRSMRELYDTMLIGDSRGTIAVEQYLAAIIESVLDLFGSEIKIERDIHLDAVEIPVRLAFPLGIIVNELLTNAMKYAFVGRTAGKLSVRLHLHDSKVTLEVQDNGVGLPEGFSLDQNNGFGTALVHMLSEQLDAQLLIESRAGTLVRLQFTPG